MVELDVVVCDVNLVGLLGYLEVWLLGVKFGWNVIDWGFYRSGYRTIGIFMVIVEMGEERDR